MPERRVPAASPEPPDTRPAGAEELLQGVPVLNPAVETVIDPKLGYLLTWKAGAGRAAGWRAWLAGPALRRRLQLDDLGRRTVELIDGRRRVGEIAAMLAAERGIAPADMRRAVLAFLALLVRHNVVQVVVGQAAAKPP